MFSVQSREDAVTKLRVLSLFAGIGGFDLGLERTGGFETVAFCEIDPFCQRVLAKNWPGVPCFEDVRTLTQECLEAAGIDRIDVITGGFPCQDVSSAGKQAGLAGERSGLWYEIVRLAGELRPRFILVENVSGLLTGERGRWFGRVLGDLAALGYDAEWECIPASAVGAPHRRDRVWIVAYAAEELCDRISVPRAFSDQKLDQGFKRVWAYVSALRAGGRSPSDFSRLRANDGVSARVDAIAALGNAVTPIIPEIIGQAILQADLSQQRAALCRNRQANSTRIASASHFEPC